MHNYPFNTGYSLTDINELSETTHTDTHIPRHTHTNLIGLRGKMNNHFVMWSIPTA